METNIIPFVYEDNMLRTILDEKSNPWFVAKDVCKILGHTNPTKAVQSLDDDERCLTKVQSPERPEGVEVNVVNEPGLYTLIIRSNKPEAKPFRRWITHEVLPTIRKTGGYGVSGAEKPASGAESPADRQIPVQIWHKIRAAGQGVRISYRVKLLGLACQMNRLDQTRPASREGVLLDYAALCENICSAPELPGDERGESVRNFIDSCCFRESGAKVQAADIYSRYAAWYLENVGDETPTATWFGRELATQFHKAKSQGCVWYYGIGLTNEGEDN